MTARSRSLEILMRAAPKSLVLAIAMSLAGCSHDVDGSRESHRPDARTEALLAGLREELQAAMTRGDRAKLEQLLDESFVFIHSTGTLESRPAFIDRVVRASASHSTPEVDFSDNDIRLYGDTAVWVTHSARRGTSLKFVATDILVKGQAGWKWVSVQSTRVEH